MDSNTDYLHSCAQRILHPPHDISGDSPKEFQTEKGDYLYTALLTPSQLANKKCTLPSGMTFLFPHDIPEIAHLDEVAIEVSM